MKNKKWTANLLDSSGAIRTGYEAVLEGTREEILCDYLYHIRENCGMEEITEKDIDLDLEESR